MWSQLSNWDLIASTTFSIKEASLFTPHWRISSGNLAIQEKSAWIVSSVFLRQVNQVLASYVRPKGFETILNESKRSIQAKKLWRNKKYSNPNNWAISARKDNNAARIRTVTNSSKHQRKRRSERILTLDQRVFKNQTTFGRRLRASLDISNKCFQFLTCPRPRRRTSWLKTHAAENLSTKWKTSSTSVSSWAAT